MSEYSEAYPYVCIECGRKVQKTQRFFWLDGLLECFRLNVAGERTNVAKYLCRFFRVGALFETPVLNAELPVFRCESRDVPTERLAEIQCSMLDVVQTIEKQLALKQGEVLKLLQAMMVIECEPEKYQYDLRELLLQSEWPESYCSEIFKDAGSMADRVKAAARPYMNQGKFGNESTQEDAFWTFMEALYALCTADPALVWKSDGWNPDPERMRKLKIGWIYTVDQRSFRMRPKGLAVCGTEETETRLCRTSCCPFCHKPLSGNFGVFRQVTVGVLGGQSAGKTTYLAALTDFIDQDISKDSYKALPFTISYEPEGDPQWRRFGAEYVPGQRGNMSPKWAYRHGYHVKKTDLMADAAASLSFLVTPKGDKEPILYVFADIAGEIFGNNREISAAESAEMTKKLLGFCDALFMVLSCDEKDAVIEAARFREWMDEFPDRRIPGALLLTKADQFLTDGTGKRMENAFHLKRVTPVVKSGEHAVYNAEVMTTFCRMASQCAERLVPGLMGELKALMESKVAGTGNGKVALAAFLVNSGTKDYLEQAEKEKGMSGQEEKEDKEAVPVQDKKEEQTESEGEKRRYWTARAERYGMAFPFFWLLALEGILECGRGDRELLQYDLKTRDEIMKYITSNLELPG